MTRRWSWSGLVALVLAVSLGAGFVIAVLAVTTHGAELDPGVVALLDVLAGAILGCVATWLGTRRQDGEPHHD